MGDQGTRVRHLQLRLRLSLPIQCVADPWPLSWLRRVPHREGLPRIDAARRAEGRRDLSLAGPINEGKGECEQVLDRRATPEQRAALLRILRGEDTEPGATIFHVFVSTCDKVHESIVADIDVEIDIDGRTAKAEIDGVIEAKGAPILNPVTGAEHRVRIVQPNGFEFAEAEIGRGSSRTMGPIRFELDDTYGQFADVHLCQSGIVRQER